MRCIKFEGVDFWSRPVFKEIDGDRRYGSVDKLIDQNTSVESIVESDLLYFGRSFDCEPMGDLPSDELKIVWGGEDHGE